MSDIAADAAMTALDGVDDAYSALSEAEQREFNEGWGGEDGSARLNDEGEAPVGGGEDGGGQGTTEEAGGSGEEAGEGARAVHDGLDDDDGLDDEGGEDQPPSDEPPSSEGDQQGGDAPASDAKADETGPSNQDGSKSGKEAEVGNDTSLEAQLDQIRQEFKTTLGRIQSTQRQQLEEAYRQGRADGMGGQAPQPGQAQGGASALPEDLVRELKEGAEMGDANAELMLKALDHIESRFQSVQGASQQAAAANEDEILLGMADAQLGGADWRDTIRLAGGESERTFENEDFDKFMQSNYTHKQIEEVLNTRDPSKFVEVILSYRAALKNPAPTSGATGEQDASKSQNARNARRDSSKGIPKSGNSDDKAPQESGNEGTFNDGWAMSAREERQRRKAAQG